MFVSWWTCTELLQEITTQEKGDTGGKRAANELKPGPYILSLSYQPQKLSTPDANPHPPIASCSTPVTVQALKHILHMYYETKQLQYMSQGSIRSSYGWNSALEHSSWVRAQSLLLFSCRLMHINKPTNFAASNTWLGILPHDVSPRLHWGSNQMHLRYLAMSIHLATATNISSHFICLAIYTKT